jgi:glyoxylase-like metal-dependent hydrolase (beta-lactamase superfamily II)
METFGGLHLETIVSDLFAENCYLVRLPDRKEALVIDPGLNPERILEAIDEHALQVAAILNTHGHADHIAGNEAVKERFPNAPLLIGRGDAPKLSDPELNLSGLFGFPLTSPPADRLVEEGDVIEFAGIRLEVRHTPGHSSGHVIYVVRGRPHVIFGGDVLFRGGVGRADLHDSDAQALLTSIREKFFDLPADTVVLPGHGQPTTVGREQRYNPFVARRGV